MDIELHTSEEGGVCSGRGKAEAEGDGEDDRGPYRQKGKLGAADEAGVIAERGGAPAVRMRGGRRSETGSFLWRIVPVTAVASMTKGPARRKRSVRLLIPQREERGEEDVEDEFEVRVQ